MASLCLMAGMTDAYYRSYEYKPYENERQLAKQEKLEAFLKNWENLRDLSLYNGNYPSWNSSIYSRPYSNYDPYTYNTRNIRYPHTSNYYLRNIDSSIDDNRDIRRFHPSMIKDMLHPVKITNMRVKKYCDYYCKTTFQGKQVYYCCRVPAPKPKPGVCPPIWKRCPRRNIFGPPNKCNADLECSGQAKCCYDYCLQHKTCKPAQPPQQLPIVPVTTRV